MTAYIALAVWFIGFSYLLYHHTDLFVRMKRNGWNRMPFCVKQTKPISSSEVALAIGGLLLVLFLATWSF